MGFTLYNNINKYFLNIGGTDYEIIEPIGFSDVEIIFKRDIKKHGFNSEYLNPDIKLEFDCNIDESTQYPAGSLINDVYDGSGSSTLPAAQKSKGNDGLIIFKFGEVDKTTLIFTSIFEGKLNLNSYIKNIDTVESTIERVSFEDLVRTRFETVFSLRATEDLNGGALTALAPEVMELHSKIIEKQYRGLPSETGIRSLTANETDGDNDGFIFTYLQFGFELIEFNEIEETFILPFAYNNSEPVFIYKVTEAGKHVFNWRFKGELDSTGNNGNVDTFNISHKIIIKYTGGSTTIFQNSKLDFSDTINLNDVIDTTGTATVTFNIDDEIQIFIAFDTDHINQNGLTGDFVTDLEDESYFEILAQTEADPTNANTFLIHEVIERNLQGITGQSDKFKSDFLGRTDSSPRTYATDGCGSLLAITNGYQIRQFDINDRPIFTSLADIFDSLNACYNLGIGFEKEGTDDILRIEDFDYFFQDKEIISLDNVSEIKYKFAKELVYNDIEIGFKKWADEEFNNLDEFATKHKYSTGIQSIKKKLSLISLYLTSGYLIEFARREQFTEAPTKDNENDQENFMITLQRSGLDFIPETDEPINTSTNVLRPDTAYNIRLSPKRNLIRFIENLRGGLIYKDQATHEIKFTYGEGNYLMTTDFENAETCEYTANIGESDNLGLTLFSGDKVFSPEWVEFKAELSFDDILQIKSAFSGSDPNLKDYGYISFVDENGASQKGWLYDMAYNMNDGETKIKLLKKPS